MDYITERIDEAHGQLCDLNDEEPIISTAEMSKSELSYLFDKIIPFFINGQAAINAEKRQMTGNYQRARADLESRGNLSFK